jgi:hypothetical protein
MERGGTILETRPDGVGEPTARGIGGVAVSEQELLVSDLPDLTGMPLDAAPSDATGTSGNNPPTPSVGISAFNSSI